MDAFFVEVERRDDSRLKGVPVVVGGAGKRGVVASASYEARKFGIRSAQPMAVAKRLCPGIVVVPPSHHKYGAASAEVFEIFRSFTPHVESLSVDEAFLDIGGLRKHFDGPAQAGMVLRQKVRDSTGLPCSAGLASSKFVAKLASESAKPDGFRHMRQQEQRGFLDSLPVQQIWGVGPATFASLQRLGIETVADLAQTPIRALESAVGLASAQHLNELARGIDLRPVVPDSKAKSFSVEETYAEDLESIEVIMTALLAHSQRLSVRLNRAGLAARTLAIKVRFADFTTVTRAHTENERLDSPRELFRIAKELVEHLDLVQGVRLLGLTATGLEPAKGCKQLSMDVSGEWRQVEDAVAHIRDRFGARSIEPARLLDMNRSEGESDG